MDADLPIPNYFYRFTTHNGASSMYGVAWLLDGYFGTARGIDYLNDILARFSLSLPILERLKHYPEEIYRHHDSVYKLKSFQNLKSMPAKTIGRWRGHDAKDDNTFWELKLWVEYNIKNNGGEGNYVEFQRLLAHAIAYYDWKDKSTARAKCRNIWRWYESRNWQYHILKKSKKTPEEILMTRQERALKNSKMKTEKARKAVVTAITGLYSDEYRKANGKWHYRKIAEVVKLDPRVVAKHIKAFEEEMASRAHITSSVAS